MSLSVTSQLQFINLCVKLKMSGWSDEWESDPMIFRIFRKKAIFQFSEIL